MALAIWFVFLGWVATELGLISKHIFTYHHVIIILLFFITICASQCVSYLDDAETIIIKPEGNTYIP